LSPQKPGSTGFCIYAGIKKMTSAFHLWPESVSTTDNKIFSKFNGF